MQLIKGLFFMCALFNLFCTNMSNGFEEKRISFNLCWCITSLKPVCNILGVLWDNLEFMSHIKG